MSSRSAAVLAVLLLLPVFPSAATAGRIYEWRTEDGTYAFTDDARRIPARYRGEARLRPTKPFADYEHLTTTDPGAGDAHARRLAERLERLRAFNRASGPEGPLAVAPRPASAVGDLGLESVVREPGRRPARRGGSGASAYRRTSRLRTAAVPQPILQLPVDPESEEPVMVETRRMLDEPGGATRHVRVIRQGDRVLGVLLDRPNMGPVHHGLIADLTR